MVLVPAVLLSLSLPVPGQAAQAGDWPAYGRDAGGSRYSPLSQITRANVAGLSVAWIHRTGDAIPGRGRFEATPIVVDGTLYVSTALGRVDALDPATGRERWSFNPGVSLAGDYGDFTNRGVSTWLDRARRAGAACRRRIFVAPVDARLIALDAATGHPCQDFGERGTVHLDRGLREGPEGLGEYEVTSPPAVVGDLVIVGSAISDNQRTNAPSGVVRAYDARTGRLRWHWDPVPQDASDPAASSWAPGRAAHTGAANVWSVIVADTALGLVYLPTGSASPDFFGGMRAGDNRHANSLVALRAATGRVVWARQLVHHDLWDYDLPSPPLLFTLRRNGQEIPAVAQGTKMGLLFFFDRRTGEPLFPIEERPVPASDAAGELASPTQPFPVAPLPLVPQQLTTDDIFGLSEAGKAECRALVAASSGGNIYDPPSLRGSVIVPGNIGGMHWGGGAIDPARQLLVAPTNRLPFLIRLVPGSAVDSVRRREGGEVSRQRGTPFGMRRTVLRGSDGVPCTKPPWGALTAVNAATGAIAWQIPLGYLPSLAAKDSAALRWGSVNLGGPMVTAGGLVFIAATADAHLRAIDIESGRELWAAALPTGGIATPMSYQAAGRQFVVVAAGGHDRLPFGPIGDYLVAFALPDPAHGAAEDSAVSATGAWIGDLRIERERLVTTMTLTKAERGFRGQLHGALEGNPHQLIEGPIRAGLDGNHFTFTATFSFPAKDCAGTITGEGQPVNYGGMLIGSVRLESTCGSHVEEGTFELRRSEVH